MFPFRDHNPASRQPIVTWLLIALNVAVFVMMLPLMADPAGLAAFYDRWGLVPARFMAGERPETALTSMFLHGGFLHLLGNMLFLYVFGDNLEDRMGRLPFLAFYIASGLGAGALQIAAGPTSSVPMVGASGAIAGVMGGYLLLFPKARVDLLVIFIFFIRIITLPASLVLAYWFVIQIVAGAFTAEADAGVAHWAHVGGFVVGGLLAVPLWLRLGGPAFWRATEGAPPHPAAATRLRRTHVPVIRRRR
ncbi:rhomboid family intramembrane serine protease [Haematobacter genomosp. 1]|uniref:Rhomboid family intramembrane serine protease n=1 Tax=Haematobacter genomosp. 1 TaxID=366618 RepID=A0A212AC94_9RHOB|nr:rhomboid family intramembrane serine protease [Haematobacter genomosp. 1]OWJ78208.1 rhomboid family intramembrane serine protease [Haematobacter genomosp. 1]